MNPAEKRKFGRVDLDVTLIGYGAAPIGNLFRPIAQEEAAAMVHAAWKAAQSFGAMLEVTEMQPLPPLIENLDSPQFAVRQQATKNLEAMARAVEPELRAALKTAANLEMQRRLQGIRFLGDHQFRKPPAEHLVHAVVDAARPEPHLGFRDVLREKPQNTRRVGDVADVLTLPRIAQQDAAATATVSVPASRPNSSSVVPISSRWR